MQPATHSSVFLHIMDVALKVLLAALTVLVSAQTPTDYRDLSNTLRKHVDKALEEANRKFGGNHHVDFHSIVGSPVRLIDCLVCKMKSGKELVHCVKKIDVNRGMLKTNRNNCQVVYLPGVWTTAGLILAAV